jgi:hypothetical protein
MDDEKVIAISNRYIELYELITGEKFNRATFLQDSDIEKAVDMELKKIALNLR